MTFPPVERCPTRLMIQLAAPRLLATRRSFCGRRGTRLRRVRPTYAERGRPRMSRLVDAETAAARKGDARQHSPGLRFERLTRDTARLHIRSEGADVVTHQVELVDVVSV